MVHAIYASSIYAQIDNNGLVCEREIKGEITSSGLETCSICHVLAIEQLTLYSRLRPYEREREIQKIGIISSYSSTTLAAYR